MNPVSRTAIRLEHLTKSFGRERVLDDISLEVPTGRALAVLGRSGTGKSVMLKHIIGLMKPDAGRVFIFDEDITMMAPAELARVRKRIGFLFQNAALFDSITVGENVAFPLRRHTKLGEGDIHRRVGQKLAEVGLDGEDRKMPAALSGGMRKRAGLARAMALDPEILLVDEPSAGLDPITSGEIDDLLIRLKSQGGATLVMVTHDVPSATRIGDELVFLHDGHVMARGSAADLETTSDPMIREFMRTVGTV
jgi:phospholipid/cholesterol/gamma-HCH transport system ATP-binding protein